MMTNLSVQCSCCGRDLIESSNEPSRQPCPFCGSTGREINIRISVVDEIRIRELIGLKVKDPTLTGKKKIKSERLIGDDLHHKTGKWCKKDRLIDRENDKYLETVIDSTTGEVIHHCDEPLSQHLLHGSAKKA